MERMHFFLINLLRHYENMPMQHTAFFHSCKNDNFLFNFCDYFHIFAQNIDCGLVGCKGMFVTRTCFRNVSSLFNLL